MTGGLEHKAPPSARSSNCFSRYKASSTPRWTNYPCFVQPCLPSHCAILLFIAGPGSGRSRCRPLRSALAVRAAAPGCLGIAAASRNGLFSSGKNWLLELNLSPKRCPCSRAFFPCPSPLRKGERAGAGGEEAALLCHGALCEGGVVEIILFAPILSQTRLLARTRWFRWCSP